MFGVDGANIEDLYDAAYFRSDITAVLAAREFSLTTRRAGTVAASMAGRRHPRRRNLALRAIPQSVGSQIHCQTTCPNCKGEPR